MKKIITLLLVLICLNLQPFAQKKVITTSKSTTNAPTKKDGTPDMRYKENKNKRSVEKRWHARQEI